MDWRKGIRESSIAARMASVFAGLLIAASLPVSLGQTQRVNQPLQFTISAESPEVIQPLPARLILHFRNVGNHPLWLYRPIRDAAAISESSLGPSPGGSTLALHLEPANAQAAAALQMPAVCTLLQPAGMPRPRLVQLAPGSNFQQTVAIHIAPAQRTGNAHEPLWGAYRISVIYGASYSNGPSINSNLGVDLWQGSIDAGPLPITLEPASAASGGSISGTVVNRQMQPDWGILVSLTDSHNRLMEQMVTGNDGGFSFSQLPYDRYWVTVRTPGSDVNTSFFEHADLSGSHPDAQLKLIMLNPEEDDAKQLAHKPVLFRIRDNAGNALGDTELQILWSNGPVLETVRTETDADGLAEANLIPGANYVTIRRRHCPKQDQLANVAAGTGIDGFAMTVGCEKQ
jgi:hypothetical protein